jgi:hypothetical protein
MAKAKMSRVEKLHALFFESLIVALEAGDPPASILSVCRAALADAKITPAISGDDRVERMKSLYTSLPFTDTEDGIPVERKTN